MELFLIFCFFVGGVLIFLRKVEVLLNNFDNVVIIGFNLVGDKYNELIRNNKFINRIKRCNY